MWHRALVITFDPVPDNDVTGVPYAWTSCAIIHLFSLSNPPNLEDSYLPWFLAFSITASRLFLNVFFETFHNFGGNLSDIVYQNVSNFYTSTNLCNLSYHTMALEKVGWTLDTWKLWNFNHVVLHWKAKWLRLFFFVVLAQPSFQFPLHLGFNRCYCGLFA